MQRPLDPYRSTPSRTAHGRGAACATVDLSDVLGELFATMHEHSAQENARRLAHVLLTGELPRRFEWSPRKAS